MVNKPRPAPIFHKNGYRLHFSYDGKQYRRFLIKDKAQAYVLQNNINMRMLQFRTGLIAPPSGVSLPDFIFANAIHSPTREASFVPHITCLSQLITEYESISRPPRKSAGTCRTEKFHLNHLKKFLQHFKYGDPPLESINVGLFDYYKAFRYAQGIRTDTLKKEHSTFQVMFQMAVDHGYVKSNVVKDVKRDESQIPTHRFRTNAEVEELLRSGQYTPKEIQEIKRFRYLTEAEIKELIALAEGKWLHPILIVFAYTGVRRGELAELEWGDVDFAHDRLTVHSKKQSRKRQVVARSIEMQAGLVQTLKAQKEITGTNRWVFPGTDGQKIKEECLRQSFHRLVQNTKFEGLGFHVFRHSLASNLAAKGVDQRLIDDILGHQTQEMRQRYQHLFPPLKRIAMQDYL
jgi:integrase